MKNSLINSKNVIIHDENRGGTGKTRFGNHVINELSANSAISLFIITMDQAIKLAHGELTGIPFEKHNIVFVEIAESNDGTILGDADFVSLMDGPIRSMYNLTFCILYKGDLTKFPNIVRPGRAEIVLFQPIRAEKVKETIS